MLTWQVLSTYCAGITAPEEYGGLSMGYRAHCIAMEVRRQAYMHVSVCASKLSPHWGVLGPHWASLQSTQACFGVCEV